MTESKLLQHTRHSLILERLNNGETLSITELSREWDIPTKTLQRDFRKLMEGSYGVVRAEDGKRFTLSRKKTTSNDTLTSLQMLESLASDIGGEFYSKAHEALKSIKSHIESPFYTRIDVENISDKMELIEKLEDAISNQKNISFKYKRYYAPDDIKTYRSVKPYKIIIFDGFFYLFCQYEDQFFKFYVKEIFDLVILDETFRYNEQALKNVEKAHNIWFDPSNEPFEVVLYLDLEEIC